MARIEIISETDGGVKSRMIVTAERADESSINVTVEFDPPLDANKPEAHPDPLGIQEAVAIHLQRGERR